MTREELLAANLRGADLSETNLSGADLSETNLSGANLRGADLSETNLSGANMRGANLRGANLSVANLSGANLSGADLSGANLSGADLSVADLSGAGLSSCSGIAHASVGWSGHGERGRTLLAVADQDGTGLDVYHCGCFRGSLSELRDYIEAGEERHKRSRRMAAELVSMLLDDAKAVAK